MVKTNHDTVDVSGKAAYSFNQIMIDPNNYQKIYINSIAVISSNDGGKSWHDVKWPPKHLFTECLAILEQCGLTLRILAPNHW
ncbi:MAG: hypothetical protein Ct9H300mP18_11300 [Candidatus Neomarinimicrobiota bacterium]|nr:MAG: hypothetical protein Ct9H300mP18_11300 [Candidatus Neomarinimicrobiota bacterium]